jgi:glycosyltransferase involved in cell wall biosynthesis
MKVAFVIPLLHKGGGTEKAVSWLIEDLKDKHEVTVITHAVNDVDMSGVRFVKIPMIRRPALLKYVTFLFGNTFYFLWQKVRAPYRYDLVCSTGPDCLFADIITAHFCIAEYLQCIRARMGGLPARSVRERFVNLTHTVYFRFARWMEHWVYPRRRTAAIIAVSEGVKQDIVRHYGRPAGDITVIPNAADNARISNPNNKAAKRIHIRANHGLGEEDFVMLFVGGDWSRKGLALLIEALTLIEFPLIKLMVVGRGDEALYMDMARKYKVADRTAFAGFQKDVASYYAVADLFVYPSYYEAFSLVTLEAMGSGLPLLAARINGTEDLIQDGWNGFFIKHHPEDIAEKVKLLYKNRELVRTMGIYGIETVSSYTRERLAVKTVAVYEKVLGMKMRKF